MAGLNLKIPARCRSVLRVGTCSWKYEGWKGLTTGPASGTQPATTSPTTPKCFNTVEVDHGSGACSRPA